MITSIDLVSIAGRGGAGYRLGQYQQLPDLTPHPSFPKHCPETVGGNTGRATSLQQRENTSMSAFIVGIDFDRKCSTIPDTLEHLDTA